MVNYFKLVLVFLRIFTHAVLIPTTFKYLFPFPRSIKNNDFVQENKRVSIVQSFDKLCDLNCYFHNNFIV